MARTEFDCFGERLPNDLPESAPQDGISRWMLRTGTGLFWLLVIVVVAARVAYFDPHLAAKFGELAAIPSAIRAILGA